LVMIFAHEVVVVLFVVSSERFCQRWEAPIGDLVSFPSAHRMVKIKEFVLIFYGFTYKIPVSSQIMGDIQKFYVGVVEKRHF